MECSEPGAVSNEEFFAYLVGEKVRPAVGEHIASCQQCSVQVRDYRQAERTLNKKLYRWDCPPNQVLGEYQLGILSKEQMSAVRLHLGICLRCAAEVAALTAFLANDPMLVERAVVPQKRVAVRPSSLNNHHAVREAKRVVETLRDQSQAGVRRIAAALLPSQPRLALQRDMASQSAIWPRRYTAEDVNISIQVEHTPNQRDVLQVIGLVTRKGVALDVLAGTPVQLTGQAQTEVTQTIDELGNFVFSSIVPATYTLEIQFPDGIIVVDQLPVALRQ